MLLEVLGATVLGLLLAYAAALRLPERFPNRPLALTTGPVAALLGGVVCRAVLGPGHTLVTLVVGAAVSVAILSVLLRDGARQSGGLRGQVAPPRPGVAGPPRA